MYDCGVLFFSVILCLSEQVEILGFFAGHRSGAKLRLDFRRHFPAVHCSGAEVRPGLSASSRRLPKGDLYIFAFDIMVLAIP